MESTLCARYLLPNHDQWDGLSVESASMKLVQFGRWLTMSISVRSM